MKDLAKCLGAIAIICIIYFSVLGLVYHEVPAKLQEPSAIQEEPQSLGNDGLVLMTALEASGAELAGTNINVWSQIKDGDYTIREMEKMALACAHHLDLERNAQVDTIQEGGYHKVMVTNQREGVYATIIMENFKLEGHPVESYLLVDLNLGQSVRNISKFESAVIEYYEGQGLDYEYAITTIGTFPKKMNIDIMRGVIEEIFESTQGQVLEGMEDGEYEELISLTGYSPRIQQHIQLSGKKINLNAAMRYSGLDEKTYLWLGTPLIATEY